MIERRRRWLKSLAKEEDKEENKEDENNEETENGSSEVKHNIDVTAVDADVPKTDKGKLFSTKTNALKARKTFMESNIGHRSHADETDHGADYTDSEEQSVAYEDYQDETETEVDEEKETEGKEEEESDGKGESETEGKGEEGTGGKEEEETEGTVVRKTFFQAHIFPKHVLESLKNGGTSTHYIEEERCTNADQCPTIEYFCSEGKGECSAEVDCSDKKENYCLCKLNVKCG